MAKQTTLPDVIDKFWETIPPVWHQTRHIIRRVAVEQFKMTVEQFQVLRRIRRGSDSVSALADVSQTSRSSVSKAVDALVNKGLVSRLSDTHDRRYVHLALTEEGARLMYGVYAETEKWLMEKFQSLTAEELDLMLQAMEIFQKVFGETRTSGPTK
jgi:DNA-binding MarR family transcriptional regulator